MNHTNYESSRILDGLESLGEYSTAFSGLDELGLSGQSLINALYKSRTRFSPDLRPSYEVLLSKIGSCAAWSVLRLLDVASPDVGSRQAGRETVVGPRDHLSCLPLQKNRSVVCRRTRKALFTFLLQVSVFSWLR